MLFFSKCKFVPCGVPQGSLMGPLLFSLFINDLPNVLENSIDKGLYADDFQFVVHGMRNDLCNIIERANIELMKISAWFKKRKLRLNAKKSSAMFVSNNDITFPKDLDEIMLDGNVVKIENCVKNLGLYMDGSLKFERHVNEMIKKVYFSLHSLKMNRNFLNEKMRSKLVQALVVPHFLYCDSIISNVNSRLKSKIEKAFKCILRFIYNLKTRESTKAFSKKIFGCELFNYFDYRFTIFVFKLIQCKEPKCLYDRLIFSKSDRTCNLNIPKFSNLQRNKFTVRSAQLWNSLPNDVKRETNFSKFKSLSFKFFSEKA